MSVLPGANSAVASVVYVDAGAGGANDGSSWLNAYTKLQDALLDASTSGGAVTEIWVAAGTYRPDQGGDQTPGDRAATFRMISGLGIYGGFAGTENDRSQRNVAANPTILTGDLSGDDIDVACTDSMDCHHFGHVCAPEGYCITPGNMSENSLHVVTYDDPAAVNAVLDGFTVMRGNADGHDGLTNQGGAIHIRKGLDKCLPGGPTIRNCIVERNSAEHHGAINDHGLSTRIENCIVRKNHSHHEGGGLQIHSGAPTIVGTLFEDNASQSEGGGAWAGNDPDPTCSGASTPTFVNCTFSRNKATVGGGMFNKTNSPTLTDCTFHHNEAFEGGGMWNEAHSMTVLSGCTFSENVAAGGGGVYNTFGCTLTVTGCTFLRNRARLPDGESYDSVGVLGGALVNSDESLATISRSSFIENSADIGGGAIQVYYPGNTVIINSLFQSNYAGVEGFPTSGGAMFIGYHQVTVIGCVFTGNSVFGADSRGGAIFHEGNETIPENALLVSNSIFNANSALRGGAIISHGLLALVNDSIYGNFAATGGGGLWAANGTAKVHNSIFWNNTAGSPWATQIGSQPGVTLDVDHSIVQGGWISPGSEGIIDTDPLFADVDGQDNIPATPDDNFRLLPGSPAIDAGQTDALPADSIDLDGDGNTMEPAPWDFDGRVRRRGLSVDMGAFEGEACMGGVVHLYADVDDNGDVNFADISTVVDIFRGVPRPVPFEIVDMSPCGGDGDVNFQDISAAVDAFKGLPQCPDLCLAPAD